MLLQDAGSVTAKRNDAEAFLARDIESGKHKFFGDSPASKFLGDLGMREDHFISFQTIFGKRHPPTECDLKAAF